jgi:secreted trypsin-like serine protease
VKAIRRLLPALLVALTLLPLAAASAQEAPPETAPDGEIIGGTRADPHEYPFQVALLAHDVQDRWAAQFCGGTLISPDTVLTAGHCVVGSRAADIDILAGTNRLLPGGGQRVPARAVRLHPGYDDNTLENDIAVIQLGVNLPYDTVAPAGPGQEALYAPGTVATTIGWGDRDLRLDVQYYPLYLREVEVPIVSDQDCSAAYPSELFVDQMVCAGDMVDGGEDSCYGDSGGPLMVPEGDEWLQVGVVSTGRGCARRPYPGIYTEVSAFEGFLTRYLDPDSVPDRVTDPRQRPVSPTASRISWKAPFFDGGTRITQYRVDLPDLGRTHTVIGSQRYFRLRNLPPGRHLVRVQAVNVVGGGAVRSFYVNL